MEGVPQIICSVPARKLKLYMLPGRLNMFEEPLMMRYLMVFSMVFSRIFLVEHIKILPGSLKMRKMGLQGFHNYFCITH